VAHHVGERAVSGATRARRLALAFAFAPLAACSSSSGDSGACGFDTPTAVRFHNSISRNTQWPQQVALAVDEMPSDSTVRILFVHASAVTEADRDFVTARGGAIEEIPEAAEWNGIVAAITVADLRALAPAADTNRIWDVHLLGEAVILPPCG
jgi:hypothetical protein